MNPHPSNTNIDEQQGSIEVTHTTNGIYAYNHTTGDGCFGNSRLDALTNLAVKHVAKTHRAPADPDRVEALLK